MDQHEAAGIIGTFGEFDSEGVLYGIGFSYVMWDPEFPGIVEMEGDYTTDQLEALAWWMRHMG